MTAYRLADAQGADRAALMALWRQVFGDEDGFIASCLDTFAGPGNVYVAADENELTAMLLAVPCTCEGADETGKGVYLYALATAPKARGRGVMTGLMRCAETDAVTKGATFAALIPANEGLFAYYAARGYTHTLALRQMQWQAGGGTAIPLEVCEPAGGLRTDILESLRSDTKAGEHIGFGAGRGALLARDIAAAGGKIARGGGAWAVYGTPGGRLQVAELGARDDAAAGALLDALCAHTGTVSAEVTLAGHPQLFAARPGVRPVPNGLLKPLGGQFEDRAPFIRFALEEIWNDDT